MGELFIVSFPYPCTPAVSLWLAMPTRRDLALAGMSLPNGMEYVISAEL